MYFMFNIVVKYKKERIDKLLVLNGALVINSLTKLNGKKQPILTYREKHDRNGESDGHQHSQPDEEHQDIQGVHPAVGVQQLRLHAAWKPGCKVWGVSSTKLWTSGSFMTSGRTR